ncbi:MAG: hypothetical protein ACEQSF_01215 [Solirubrobacteraceae bacterium]
MPKKNEKVTIALKKTTNVDMFSLIGRDPVTGPPPVDAKVNVEKRKAVKVIIFFISKFNFYVTKL